MPSTELIRHERKLQTVERVRELEQVSAKAATFLEARQIASTADGWLLDERMGIVLGLDGVLRCQARTQGLVPLCFDYYAGDEWILDGARDNRHLRVDEEGANVILHAAFEPVRLIFFDNTNFGGDLRNDVKYELMEWFFERVLELAV